jgi:hypothetical protein
MTRVLKLSPSTQFISGVYCNFIMPLRIKFHVSSSDGPLVIAIILKARYRINAAVILFYTLQKVPSKSWTSFLNTVTYCQATAPQRHSNTQQWKLCSQWTNVTARC